jgi:hypothetical protein
MNRSEIEKYKYTLAKLTFTQFIRMPGKQIIDGTEQDVMIKREVKNIRIGTIIALTTSKVIFLLNEVEDSDEDLEIAIPYSRITDVEPMKIK